MGRELWNWWGVREMKKKLVCVLYMYQVPTKNVINYVQLSTNLKKIKLSVLGQKSVSVSSKDNCIYQVWERKGNTHSRRGKLGQEDNELLYRPCRIFSCKPKTAPRQEQEIWHMISKDTKHHQEVGCGAHACNLSTWVAGTRGQQIRLVPGQFREILSQNKK